MQFPFMLPLIGIAAFAFFWLLHWLGWRLLPESRKGVLLLLKLSAMAALLSAAAAHAWLGMRWIDLVCVAGPVQAFLTLAYLHLYVGTCRSLSVRILDELLRVGGTMTPEELEAAYSLDFMFSSRLQILQEHGWITCRDGLYACTGKGRLFGGLIRAARKLYRIERAG